MVLEELFQICSGVYVEAELYVLLNTYLLLQLFVQYSYYIGTSKDASEYILSVTAQSDIQFKSKYIIIYSFHCIHPTIQNMLYEMMLVLVVITNLIKYQ